MDLSGLKWPLIIGVVVLIGWLMSSGGVNYMVNNFSKAEVGANAEQDKADEAGLSRLSSYLIFTFQYNKCAKVLELTLDRYGPAGANYWNNISRLSACREEQKRYQEAYDLIKLLIAGNANAKDPRVPDNEALRLRAEKLAELHELKR